MRWVLRRHVIESGTRVGHYEIIEPLGSGGMGEVYRARDSRLERSVAIKLLPQELQQDAEAMARFQREARIISGLSHPHILTIHEVGKARLPGAWRATHYMVTEFIDGVTMRQVMSSETNAAKLLEYLAQVADGLLKAHTAGVVHRDLKPENIMITRDGYAKVLDFGLAKLVGAFSSDERARTERFNTQQGIVIGTVGYMSPEQVQGKPLDHRSDMFSFGCILYEILAGRRAFEAAGLVDTLHLIVHGAMEPLPSSVAPELRRVVERCLAKKKSARYASMRVVANALRETSRAWEAVVRPASRRVRAESSSSRIKAIAVMPFLNAGKDPETEYLSDGITETIIQLLSRVGRRLKVMARTTVFAYKDREYTPQMLADELGVTSVVMGRVRQVGTALVITVELVNTQDGTQIWGENYRTSLTDVFDVHDAIASQIAEQLRLKLTTSERRRLAHRQTRKKEAYQLYLKGRFHMNRRTTESMQRAIELFEEAMASDPAYALAHAGLADCYVLLAGRFLAPPIEAYARAEEAARKAIQLDPALAEGHATMGTLQFVHRWSWTEADREFRKAIELDPSYVTGHHWYSVFLNSMGRYDQALKEARIALDLDPLSLVLNSQYAEVLYFSGRLEDSLLHCRKTLELEPSNFLVQLLMSRVLVSMRRHKESLAAIETAITSAGRYPELLATLAFIHVSMGKVSRARAILQELQEMTARTFVSPIFLAEVFLALGDVEAALTHVESFLRMHGEPVDLLVGPRFETLRRDSRYDEMIERVGFPPRGLSEPTAFALTAVL